MFKIGLNINVGLGVHKVVSVGVGLVANFCVRATQLGVELTVVVSIVLGVRAWRRDDKLLTHTVIKGQFSTLVSSPATTTDNTNDDGSYEQNHNSNNDTNDPAGQCDKSGNIGVGDVSINSQVIGRVQSNQV